MPNSINSLSPDLRDYLLNRNIISDTITSSGLDTLLQGIGIPSEISHSPESVQPSENIEVDGVFYKDLNVIINKYQGSDDDYEKVSINYLPGNTNSTWAGIPFNHESYKPGVAQLFDYTETNVPANGPFQGGNIREFNTTKNNFLDVSKQTKIDFNTQPVPSYQIGSYLDEYGALNVGGADTQTLDVLGSILNGGGVGFDPNGGGVVPDFDVRSSLVGRALNAGGAINDTKLGTLAVKYLAASIGNSVAMNLQEETIGRINLNPLSLLKGNNIIVPNYNITVAKGTLGKILDLGERMLGFETPVSLLGPGSSIFSKENPVGNIERAQSMILNTGKGQVLALIASLDQNLYKPQISDDRKKEGTAPTGEDGTNGTLYAFNNGDGGVVDLLNSSNIEGVTPAFLPNGLPDPTFIAQVSNAGAFESEHGKITSELNGGFNDEFGNLTHANSRNDSEAKFMWADKGSNKTNSEGASTGLQAFEDLGVKKSLLSKTKELFNSNKMRTLTSGHYVKDEKISEIQSGMHTKFSASGKLSKGSGVLSKGVLKGTATDGDKIFCRTWSTYDKYSSVNDLVRHSGLKKNLMINPHANVDASVLDKQGFPQIGPYNDRVNTSVDANGKKVNVENYMFSIENLAWYGSDMMSFLPDCEIGPGDPVTGRNGRIMWFPPYDISFNETTSVSLERNNFIGRGEPIYTYNNTERMGTLSWKIIIDHPNYMNFFPENWGDNEIASFYAGCLEDEKIVRKVFTSNERNEIELAEKPIVKEVVDEAEPGELTFIVYFKNDTTDISTLYENGKRNNAPDGDPNGYIEDTDIMGCYKSKLNDEGTALECIAGYGLGTTIGEGIVGSKGKVYNDLTNFGLNGQDQPISFKGKTHRGWMDDDFLPNLSDYISNECKYCKITIEGYASSQGASSKNQKLSQKRADNVKSWLISNVVPKNDTVSPEKRVVISEPTGKGETETGCTGEGGQDRGACKLGRKTIVTIKYDADLKPAPPPPVVDKKVEPPIQSKQNLAMNPSRFFSECDYFTRLEETSPIVYDEIKRKIPYFHPSFHSTTPEGFNSRLTFLQQCTRQGPTLSSDKSNPSNLAFGRPPVCILRIGDFYHTKIMMESLTIDYDPLVWDLNPEGVGVQPMIANVTVSFVFIGGSSLKGPINKLQNAVSFNYFANTELYDVRADVVKEDGTVGNYINEAAESEKQKDKNTEPIVEDQEVVAKEIVEEEPPEPEESDAVKALKNAQLNGWTDDDSGLVTVGVWTDGAFNDKDWNYNITVFQNNQRVKIDTGTLDLEKFDDDNRFEIVVSKLTRSFVGKVTREVDTGRKYSKYGPNCFSASTDTVIVDEIPIGVEFWKDGEETIQRGLAPYVLGCDDLDNEQTRGDLVPGTDNAVFNLMRCISCP